MEMDYWRNIWNYFMNKYGQTIIEIGIVIAIINVLIAIVFPMIRFGKDSELDIATYQMVLDLRNMQQDSMNTSLIANEVDITKSNQFQVLRLKNNGDKSGYNIRRGLTSIKAVYFNRSIKVFMQSDSISFNNNGYITQPQTITLSNNKKFRYIIIDRVGRIRMQ